MHQRRFYGSIVVTLWRRLVKQICEVKTFLRTFPIFKLLEERNFGRSCTKFDEPLIQGNPNNSHQNNLNLLAFLIQTLLSDEN